MKLKILAICLSSLLFSSLFAQKKEVPQQKMQEIFEEVKTPFKYGLVVVPADYTKQIDCPTVFRKGNHWYMSYLVFNGRGYETWLSQSDNLLNWKSLGRMMSFSANTTIWSPQQKAGYVALQDT